MGSHDKVENSCSYLRDFYDKRRVIWVKLENLLQRQTMENQVRIWLQFNKADFFHDLHRVYVKPKHIKIDL